MGGVLDSGRFQDLKTGMNMISQHRAHDEVFDRELRKGTRRKAHVLYLNRTYLLESCIYYDLDFTGLFLDFFEGITSLDNDSLRTD